MHRFDIKSFQNVEILRKTFKTTQTNESHQIIIMASIWRLNDQNIWVTSQNYESDQIILHCIDLTSKRSKHLSYVAKLRKWSNYSQIDAMQYNLITFVVLRRNSNVLIVKTSNRCHYYNLMTFVGLRCFECFAKYLNILEWFDVKSMQSIVIWLLL